MADLANAGFGAGTFSLAGTTYHTQGPPSCGLELDMAFLTPDVLTVPSDASITSCVPTAKATLMEVSKAIVDLAWGTSASGVLGNPVNKSVAAGIAVVVTWDQLIVTLTEALVADPGEITSANGEYMKLDANYKGISSDGIIAAGSVADPV